MTVWNDLARATNAAGDEILLRQRDSLYEIRYNGIELMSNLNHQSEAVLATRALRLLGRAPRDVLIAGLGMGYTLRAALDLVGPGAQVTVCELVPEIVAWNHGRLSHLAGHPLTDPRVSVEIADVTAVLARNPGRFDVILMDTDNGPDTLVRDTNGAIYTESGLSRSRGALAKGGIAAFWSAEIAPGFEQRLTRQGWPWRRDDIALMPGRVDAMHHIYFAADDAAALGLKKAA